MLKPEQTEHTLRYHCVFAIIVLLAIVIRVLYYMGPSGADDMIYFSILEELLVKGDVASTITSFKHWGVRLGLIFPAWMFMKIFGVSQVSSYLFPLIVSTATMFFIYIAGSRLFNPSVALLSSALFALLPQDVYLSTVMYPDGPVVLFGSIFMYLFYEQAISEKASIKQSLVAGLVLGLAFYIRETAVLLLIAVPLLFFRAPVKKNYCLSVFYVGVGLLIAVGLEMVLFWIISGDPFLRFNILLFQSKVLEPRGMTTYGHTYMGHRYTNYLFNPFFVLLTTHWISPLMILITAGMFILFATRKSGYQFFSVKRGHFLWLSILTFGTLAYYTHGPIYGLTIPLKRSVRYYHVITPLATLILGAIIYEFVVQKNIKRYIGYLMVLFYVVTSLFCLSSIMNKNALGLDLIEEFIAKNPAQNYLMPKMLKKVLQVKHGLSYMQEKIVTYTYDEAVIDSVLADVHNSGSVQYLFYVPQIHEIQNSFEGDIIWPVDKMTLADIMSTPPSVGCRILKLSDAIYDRMPALLQSKLCFTADVRVYRLK